MTITLRGGNFSHFIEQKAQAQGGLMSHSKLHTPSKRQASKPKSFDFKFSTSTIPQIIQYCDSTINN